MATKTKRTQYTVKTTKKEISVSDGEVTIIVEISDKNLHMLSGRDDEFVFKSKNAKETVERWEKVVACMQTALQVIKTEHTL